MAHTRKRIRKLSTAVFRGSRLEYSFDVYPITTAITDNAVVFIFSRRKVDKHGRGHHAVSCVGETQSIVAEIRKHKRARCLKSNEANVVCILKEADRAIRSGVLEDIAAVRAFSCVRGKFKPTIKAKLDHRSAKIAKILLFKPAAKTKSTRADADIAIKPSVVSKRKSVKSAKRNEVVQPIAKSASAASAKAKKGKSTTSRTRVPGRVGSDGGQRRLSDKKRPAARGAKTRARRNSRSHTKLAA